MPELMQSTGARMVEVGTTNKTRISDYRDAADPDTALILRVHPSNYKIVGFTERPELEELITLSEELSIPLVEDAGSGLLFSSSQPFLKTEPSVRSTLRAGTDLICFSADKLLGGPQGGIIVGKKDLVEAIRKNPLMRACRLDKITYAALSWTLGQYEQGCQDETIPVQRMLAAPAAEIERRARRLACLIDPQWFHVEVVPGVSLIGGGAAPEEEIPTALLAITSPHLTVNEIENHLRQYSQPILARIEADRLLLDLRTVFSPQEDLIAAAFSELAQPE